MIVLPHAAGGRQVQMQRLHDELSADPSADFHPLGSSNAGTGADAAHGGSHHAGGADGNAAFGNTFRRMKKPPAVPGHCQTLQNYSVDDEGCVCL